MSAIAGMAGDRTDSVTAEKMMALMRAGKPDETGAYFGKGCFLLHSRQAMQDLSGGRQPVQLELGQERFTLVFHGEIYNAPELRRELKALGHHFVTGSDTETVLHAYARWREACLLKINGTFSFAVWEEKSQTLFAARDRIGVKPFFYHINEDRMIFGSEIKLILASPGIKAELDREGIAQLLLLGPGRVPGSGVLHGIQELEPGCWGSFRMGRWHTERYWQLRDREHQERFGETADHVRFLVQDAIRRQLRAEVPMGVFLSGGLDSSIISAFCAAERARPVPAFSLDFQDNGKYFRPGRFQPSSDSDYIGIMEKAISCTPHHTVLTPEQQLVELENATRARDLPGMGDVDFSLLAFCRQIRGHVKGILSGECADEIFGGYPWYRQEALLYAKGFPWAQNIGERADYLVPGALGDIRPEEFVLDHYRDTLSSCHILPGTEPGEKRMKEMVNLNFRWFMQTLLSRSEAMGNAAGLEIRVPYCDYRIAEYLYGIPRAFRFYGDQEKGLLRYAFRDLLPEEILHRKKSPYPKTWDPHYLELVKTRLKTLLDDKNAPILQIIRREKLQSLLDAEASGHWYGQLMGLPQTIAYFLQMDFWLREYHVIIL